jgi:hypothetical protein
LGFSGVALPRPLPTFCLFAAVTFLNPSAGLDGWFVLGYVGLVARGGRSLGIKLVDILAGGAVGTDTGSPVAAIFSCSVGSRTKCFYCMMRCGGTDGDRRCDVFNANACKLKAYFGKLQITDVLRYAWSLIELEVGQESSQLDLDFEFVTEGIVEILKDAVKASNIFLNG